MNSIQFSPNGQRFVHLSRTRDASGRLGKWGVKVWDWSTGREVFARSDFTNVVTSPAFDPSATRLATGIARPRDQGGGDLIIWDIDGGKQLLAIPLPDGRFRELVFDPVQSGWNTHRRPVTARPTLCRKRPSAQLRAWDAATGKELFRHDTGPRATGLAYSPDGRTLAVSCDGGPMHRIRDAGSGKEILKLTMEEDDQKNRNGPDSIAFSPDGTRMAYVPEGGKVQIWDVTPDETRVSRSQDLILKGNWAIVSQVAWSADGRFVSACGQNGKIVTWQILAQDEHLTLKGTDEATWVGPTSAASANRFAAAFETKRGLGKTEIKVWDQAGQVLFQTTEPALDGPRISSHGRAVELSRDGTRLAYHATYRVSNRWGRKDGRSDPGLGHRYRSKRVPSRPRRDQCPRRGSQVRRRCPQFRWTASGDEFGQRSLIGRILVGAKVVAFRLGARFGRRAPPSRSGWGVPVQRSSSAPTAAESRARSGLDPSGLRLPSFFESGMSRRARWS